MALSSLEVFSQYAYLAVSEVLAQQIELFNAASQGAITLKAGANQGDFADKAFYQKISGLVRRRDPYGSGAVAAKNMIHILDTTVKVGAGTPPVEMDPSQWKWIQRSPEEGGVALGQQLAKDIMADMLNTSIGAGYAALSGESEVIYDGSAASLSNASLINGAAKFGDRAQDIKAWIMHSSPLHDLYGNANANAENLFEYGTVNIKADQFGRVFIASDSASLFEVDGVGAGINEYHTLGLAAGAINIEENNDFTDNFQTTNGDENIGRTYQAEWSYNLGIKGFAWDKTNGGAAPNDAALVVATNWDRNATSHKDIAGVIVESR